MKKIIVTTKQIPLLREENTTTVQVATNNNDAATALSKGNVQTDINNAKTTFGGNITAQFTPSDGPADTTITIPNAVGGLNGAAESIKDNSQEVTKALGNKMNVGIDVSEGMKFSKKQIEEARLKKMKSEGTVFTKKQLEESFINEEDGTDIIDIRNQIGKTYGDKAFKAYAAIGGDVNDFSGWGNIVDIIINKYKSASPQDQEKFRHILNGGSECDYEEPIDIEMDGGILQEIKMNGGVSKSSNIDTLCEVLSNTIYEDTCHIQRRFRAPHGVEEINEMLSTIEHIKQCGIKLKESLKNYSLTEVPQESNNEMKNLIKRGHRIYFKGEKCWYMVPNANGEFNVYDDGEYEGHYCGSLKYLESLQNGSEALDYVLSGL